MGTTGRWRITLLTLPLILLLSACVRPLLDREAEPTVEPVIRPQPTLPLAVPTPIVTPQGETEPPPVETIVEDEAPQDLIEEDTVEPVPSPEEGSTEVDYIVQAGDTLGTIAQRYNISIEALAAANGISNVNVLDVGQRLIIPVGGEVTAPAATPTADSDATVERVHIVQPGENLYRIGLQYGFTYQELADYNGLLDPTRLSVGQEIRIPPSTN